MPVPEWPVPKWYVGLDLAWGLRNRTGIAVLDGAGALRLMQSTHTNEEIISALAPYDAPLLVGFDAPVVVPNRTGGRECERALNQDFARFQAGCYLTNLSQPAFADGGRALRLSRLLGLATGPADSPAMGRGRAIEVFPHAASIVLFGLDRTLKYKRRNRAFPARRAALDTLTQHLEALEDADPPMDVVRHEEWTATRDKVRRAGRHAHLDRVEDGVDAVLCAYVGLFATAHPERTRTYGNASEGAIITPGLEWDADGR